MERKTHWEQIYTTKDSAQVSWYRPHLDVSLQMIQRTGVDHGARIIDIGGGASTLVDDLLAAGYQDVTVLDISQASLDVARDRLGAAAQSVTWMEADITQADLPENQYDIWHDRAVFHFLTQAENRARYAAAWTWYVIAQRACTSSLVKALNASKTCARLIPRPSAQPSSSSTVIGKSDERKLAPSLKHS